MDELFGILHEDADLLVIHKPAGLVCHPTKADARSSLVGRLRLYAGGKPAASASAAGSAGHPRFHLVNRLDRETSGLIVVAKQDGAARELRRLWESREVHKEYLAIVHGHVPDDEGAVDAPLGPDPNSEVAVKDCVRPDGAPAQTAFRVERRFSRPEGRFTLLRVTPCTGRKHQIRIHLAHAGHPVVGDKIYGGNETLYLDFVRGLLTEEGRRRLILPHQALHAARLRFAWRDRDWRFEAEPEEWFAAFAAAPGP